MTLALRLGRTLAELRESMSASELMLWAEFDKTSPIGDIRADIRAAQMTAAVINSQGGKVSLDDVLLRWRDDEEIADADPFAGLEAALMAAAK